VSSTIRSNNIWMNRLDGRNRLRIYNSILIN
jgi:hypothetical protein